MKQAKLGLAMIALVLGVVMSSFTTKVTSLDDNMLWFDATGLSFVDYGTASDVAFNRSLSETQGIGADKILIGYEDSPENVDVKYENVTRASSIDPVTDATLILDGGLPFQEDAALYEIVQ